MFDLCTKTVNGLTLMSNIKFSNLFKGGVL